MRTTRVMALLAGGLLAAGIAAAAGRRNAGDPAKGKQNYMDFCVLCHGASGKGDGPMATSLPTGPRNHTDGASMNTLTNAHLFTITKKDGGAVGTFPTMSAWGTQMSDDEIRDTIAYCAVRNLGDSSEETA